MPADADTIKAKIEAELAGFVDARVVAFVRDLLVEPKRVDRIWDYGPPGQRYPCWTVLGNGGVGIAYCEQGFGPLNPWGLVWLAGDDHRQSIGPDSGWFPTFLDAVREEALAGLPIWRVFKKDAAGISVPISDEGAWDKTWTEVMKRREADPDGWYDCNITAL